MATTYSDIPPSWVSGDTVEFTKSVPDYPASDGWTLKYHFRAPEVSANKTFYAGAVASRTVKALDVTATADGAGYSITISAANSATLFPGRWAYSARVTNGDGEAHTVATGFVDIEANLQAQTASTYDNRTEAEYNLDLVNEAIRSIVSRKMSSVSIAGRTYSYHDLDALRRLKAHWAGKVAREKGTGPQVMLARFRGVL